MAIDHLTLSQVCNLVRYDSETGLLYRTAFTPGTRRGRDLGEIKCKPNANGYFVIHVAGKRVYAHRLAWLLHYGCWPNASLDHINGNKADNRILNLRICDAATNQQNIRAAKSGSMTGLLGVSMDKESGKFMAQITHNRKNIHLGRFESADLAHAAYLGAKRAIHKACSI
jgi:hypothetical protein